MVLMSTIIATATASESPAQIGRVFPSERTVVRDDVTGADLVVLTNGQQSDSRLYPTHPQWTADGQWIVFRTGSRGAGWQAYAVHERDGTIVQLSEGPGNNPGSICLSRREMAMIYLRNASAARREAQRQRQSPGDTTDTAAPPSTQPTATPAATQPATRPSGLDDEIQVIRTDLGALLADAVAGTVRDASAYERVLATLPRGTREAGGLALDADEHTLYLSIRGGDVGKHLPPGTSVWVKPENLRMGTGPGGLRALDLRTGQLRHVLDTPFQVGHVQTNPFVSGEIIFCHETGGDAPQRIWTVNADGTGFRPLFEEGPLDWVTHEVVVTPDEIMFNLIGHQARLRVRPTGIAVLNLRTNAVQVLGQIDERGGAADLALPAENAAGDDSYGGFWHCNGSRDGRFAVGDTFTGKVYLIDRRDGRRVLLTVDHKMRPDHAHPTFSDDGTRVLIQSGKFTDGQRLQVVVVPVPDELLKK
jgi:oligogalacturonide lyase